MTPPADPPVTADDVDAAASRIDGAVHRTPVLTSATLDALTGASLHLKAEHLQRGGAFKLRGATNALRRLTAAQRATGVVAMSSGNHAQAVAIAAGRLGVPATILMPEDAPAGKLAATRGYGAEIVAYDRVRQDREALAAALAEERGATLIPPFDHPDIVAGQGTAARELLAQVEGLDLVVVPVGGGGLAAGTAAVAAAAGVEVVGVEPAARTAARDALERGTVVQVAVPDTICDGQRTTHIGAVPLAVLAAHRVTVTAVTDDEVRAAMRWLAERAKAVVEPSGASALAAVLAGRVAVRGLRVGVILSGGNVDLDRLGELLARPAPTAGAR